ncbi:MAG: 16S rRNA (cytidine(1402)-2'-O)-methyltransferase [Ignavibacteria bacterium]|jgi:16S rRNA (cytidine1402-2'-O)-methyltransferase|nr:16S rRNA (cytidine(1402)-2'-O)-methyltransferase [Ignavibacteria bacterium]MDH7527640.1 16S rRNA (cytidine(1402)-2'-O)-methyltransferase [Ignavibacteria bacterium]
MSGTLYLVATPIGNLEDISKRAIDILSTVDLILCEDTRESGKLLSHYGIKNNLMSYYSQVEDQKIPLIINSLKEGKNIALVSDSGTPCISDPGSKLVSACVENEIKVVPIPGPNSIIPALVLSGFEIKSFYFEGFIPQKKGRKKKLEEIANRKEMTVFFESPYRIQKLINELNELCPQREIALCRELTKKFEEVIRGKISDIKKNLASIKLKGEFVVIINSVK